MEAFIYDAVRTPRGRGKADGSLHEVTPVQLAVQVLEAVRDRNHIDTADLDDVIRPGVEAWASTRTKQQAAADLAAAGVAAGPVNTAADIVADPHVRGRGFVHHVATPEHDVHVVGNPISFRTPDSERVDEHVVEAAAELRWPTLGMSTDDVLTRLLGLDHEQLGELRNQGVIA